MTVADPNPHGLNVAETAAWLELHYATFPEDRWLSVFSIDRSETRTGDFRHVDWGLTGRLTALAQTIQQRAATCDVWLGAATRTANLGPQRGGAEHCQQIPGLWIDIDIAGPGHADTSQLPADLPAAQAMVAAFPLPPTVTVHTGGGIHVWWLFSEPLDLGEALPLLARWEHRWQEIARVHRVAIDSVWDPARVMRIPGTLNRKVEPARPVYVLDGNRGARYGPDDILELCPELPAPAPIISLEQRRTYHGPERPGDAFNRQHTCQDVLATTHHFQPTRQLRNGEHHYHYHQAANDTSLVVYPDGHAAIFSDTATRSLPGAQQHHAYDPFGLYALLHHDGEYSEASAELRRLGYGGTLDVDVSWITDRQESQTNLQSDTDAPWPDPTPLRGATVNLPPWPAHTLPNWIADFAAEAADQLQVPVDLICQQIVGVLSAICAGRRTIRIRNGWTDTLNLYLATAMPSGVGKSPANKAAVAPLRDIEHDLQQQDLIEAARHDSQRRVAENRLKTAEAAAAKSGDMAPVYDAIEALEQIPASRTRRLIVGDATPEALAIAMAANDERIAIISPEGTVFDTAGGLYSNGTPNIDIYLNGWDGAPSDALRVGRTNINLARPVLTIAVTVQPSALAAMRANTQLEGRGFVNRFMYAVPADMRGTRNRLALNNDPVLHHADAYNTGIRRMADALLEALHAEVRLTDDARQLFLAYDHALEQRIGPDGDLRPISDWRSKLTASIARLAGLLALADIPGATTVDGSHMQRALVVADYWIAHSLAVHDGDQLDPVWDDAHTIITWATGAGMDTFTKNEAHRFNQRRWKRRADADGCKDAEVVAAAIDRLEDCGWIRAEKVVGPAGGRPQIVCHINPAARGCVIRPSEESPGRHGVASVTSPVGDNHFTTTTPPRNPLGPPPFESHEPGDATDATPPGPTPADLLFGPGGDDDPDQEDTP